MTIGTPHICIGGGNAHRDLLAFLRFHEDIRQFHRADVAPLRLPEHFGPAKHVEFVANPLLDDLCDPVNGQSIGVRHYDSRGVPYFDSHCKFPADLGVGVAAASSAQVREQHNWNPEQVANGFQFPRQNRSRHGCEPSIELCAAVDNRRSSIGQDKHEQSPQAAQPAFHGASST